MNPITLTTVAEPLIRQALAEDITNEDVSTAAIMPDARPAAVDLIAKADGVLCGLDVFERTFAILDPETRVQRFAADGDSVCAGQTLATVTGDVRVLLSGERVALNYLQRMSGIATYTHRVAALLEGSITQLVDTRKTTPNMRVFEKEAVRCGGGRNHRYNLSDGVLLKDNHIAAAGGVREAIEAARAHAPFVREIEVECETFAQVEEAIAAEADIIMLDNMDHDAMAKAVAFIDGRAKTECSGNIDAHNVQAIADLGIDFVSSGALTHSAPILDVSMKHLRMLDGNADSEAGATGNNTPGKRAVAMAAKSEARRASLLDALRSADAPVSGGQLANTLSVSRQIIVQDIALLREAGANIVATTKGYVLADTAQTSAQNATQTMTQNAAEQPAMRLDEPARTFKLHHEVDQTRDELQTIIALGGRVHNVSISHRAYGRITAPLEIAGQADIERFINDIESGKSSPLSTATSGYHYHLVSAPSDEALESIGRALADKGFLAPLLPHEQEG